MHLESEISRVYLPDIVGKGYGAFWRFKGRYRACKGSRASKKSKTMALWLIYHIMKHPEANALVVRKTFATIRDSCFSDLKWAAQRLGVYHLWDFTTSPLYAKYKPTGQLICFRGLDDPMKITSISVPTGYLCWLWIEEAFEVDSEEDFDMLDESIRGEIPPETGLWKQITLTFNPWLQSHWIKKRFFDIGPDENVLAITTNYLCNEWLDEKDRKRFDDMKVRNPSRYRVAGLGEWGLEGGQYFSEFETGKHVIKPFEIPKHWRKYFTMDYGLDMLAGYWIAVDEEGYAYVYREIYKSGLIISDAAKAIKQLDDDDIYAYFAPPDLWNRRQDTGKSAADIFAENGVPVVKAKNDRVQGWLDLHEWLKPCLDIFGKDRPHLQIFENCLNLIRTLPSLQFDSKNPNDVAKEPHELTHAPDAIRYFVAGRPISADKPINDDETPLSFEEEVSDFVNFGI
jgi:phage terminase large subunit